MLDARSCDFHLVLPSTNTLLSTPLAGPTSSNAMCPSRKQPFIWTSGRKARQRIQCQMWRVLNKTHLRPLCGFLRRFYKTSPSGLGTASHQQAPHVCCLWVLESPTLQLTLWAVDCLETTQLQHCAKVEQTRNHSSANERFSVS